MADIDPSAPSLNLTPEEKRVFGQLFRQADTENLGVVTGEVAVKFFEKTRLEPRILGEIWQIADKENRGLLTPAGFGIVLRLIGHYQAGRDPSPDLALRPGPLPKFDGGFGGGAISPTFQPPPGPPPGVLQAQSSGSGPIRVPPLTADKATQYAQLFEKSGAQGGILPGEQAKQIFERAGLPNEVLGRIWMLADSEQRGALTATEFVIAMHLLASYKSGSLRGLPNVLPAGLYEAAARRAPIRQASGQSTAIPRQFSGAGRASSPLSRPVYNSPPTQFPQATGASTQFPQATGASPQFPQGTGMGNDWAISPQEKSKYDSIYATIDRANVGFITGEQAVPFFGESKLPEEVLAHIWDLSNIKIPGQLTRDEFAVAMYLIRQQRGKPNGQDSLPQTLPLNLIPPSLRSQARSNVPSASTFDAPPAIPKSAADDLFGLDALSSTPALVPQAPQSEGSSPSLTGKGQLSIDPFGSAGSPLTPNSPTQMSPPPSSVFKPFAPSSSFGQTLNYQATGGSNHSGFSQSRSFPPQPPASEDLLGDNDPEISKKLTDETTELANLSNQVGTLSKQLQEVKGQRISTQNQLTQADTQKLQFEQRLKQFRELYEQEVKDVKSLQERLTASQNDTRKIQNETAILEGTYGDLQNQHREIVTALQADQQENASLKERMRVINAEVAQLKPALEKLRSDARQQKGMVAINKKQLATNEGERDKLKQEAEELHKSIEEDTKILAAAASVKESSRVGSPAPVASPAPSAMSATNPFFRRQGSTSEGPHAAAPGPAQQDRSFDNLFGPAFGSSSTARTASPTSFRHDGERRPSTAASATGSALPIRSQTTGDFPRQAASPALSHADLPPAHEAPPAQAESRQISPSFLPMPEHSQSMTTSREVSPPNSRFGDVSAGGDTPTNYMGTTPTSSNNTGQAEFAREDLHGLERQKQSSPTPSELVKDSLPGAFPESQSKGSSVRSEQNALAGSDPFEMTKGKEPIRPGSAKDDFDSAFASFGSSARPQERSFTGNSGSSTAPAGFHKEFPPIAELENDDSDSNSEGGGFDDDFAPPSPEQDRSAGAGDTPKAMSPPASNGNLSSFMSRPGTAQTASSLGRGAEPPAAGTQISPPVYDKVVPSAEQAQVQQQQFGGLLPSREVPEAIASPVHNTDGGSKVSAQPTPPAKIPFDNDFDDFDDLEDAKEGSDEEFANISMPNRSGSGMGDFNPTFDSPPTTLKSAEPSFGGESSFGNFTPSTQQGSHVLQQSAAAPAHDNQDWDAIFAGLDEPKGSENAAAAAAPAHTESVPVKPNGSTAVPAKPELGRALTTTGAHDDPILKNLTGMGYSREDALAALEKYDYDLERAANFLASQS